MLKFSMVVWFVLSAVSLALADDDAPKKSPATKPAATRVGIVDVNRLFKKDAELKKQLADLQAEGMLVQAKFESELKSLQKKAEDLKDLTAGTSEYTKLETMLVKRKGEIQTDIALKRKEFVQREAQIYLSAYQQIKKDVAEVAKGRRLSLVMNVNLDPIAEASPEDVARGISNKVVWYDDSIDLTPELEKKHEK